MLCSYCSAVRGCARRWDEWGTCWVARRYTVALHCAASAILISLESPKRLVREKRLKIEQTGRVGGRRDGAVKQAENRNGNSPKNEDGSTKDTNDKGRQINESVEKSIKSIKLDCLESIEQVVNLEAYEAREDVIGGLGCIAMAVDTSQRLEGERRNKYRKKKRRRIWNSKVYNAIISITMISFQLQ